MSKTTKNNIICAVGLNLIVIILYFSLFNIILETNDEFAFSAFLGGAYGVSSAHMVFSNIFYGFFLKPFYSLGLGINWYSIFQIFFNFVSFSSISYICLMKTEKYGKKFFRCLACFAVLLVFAYEHYYLMQFTKSAYLIALAGVLIMLYALHKDGSNKAIAIGTMLILIGSFIRFSAVYVVLAFAFLRCMYDLLGLQKFRLNRNYIINNRRYIVSFLIMLVLVFGFDFADTMVYKYGPQNGQWAYYTRYNVARSELLDYGIPEYEENVEEYQHLGLSETDVKMLNNWSFSDPEIFNLEMLEKIVELKEKESISLRQVLIDTIKNCFDGIHSNVGIITVLVFVMSFVCCDNKHRLLISAYACMVFVLYGYLTYIDRVIFRSEYGIWLCLFTLLVYDFPRLRRAKKASIIFCKLTWTMLVVGILFFSIKAYDLNQDVYTKTLQSQYRQLFDYTNSHKEVLYMRDVSTLSDWNQGYSALQALPFGYLSNIYLLGGWEIENPITSVETAYGIYNPWRECVDSDTIYIIDNRRIELKLDYIRQHYCPTAKAIQVNEVAGFKMYKIVS